jgi:hypothetical protein
MACDPAHVRSWCRRYLQGRQVGLLHAVIDALATCFHRRRGQQRFRSVGHDLRRHGPARNQRGTGRVCMS